MTELAELIRAYDEWEAADDRANQAAAALSRPTPLSAQELEEVRKFQRAAAAKFEYVRRAVVSDR